MRVYNYYTVYIHRGCYNGMRDGSGICNGVKRMHTVHGISETRVRLTVVDFSVGPFRVLRLYVHIPDMWYGGDVRIIYLYIRVCV
jgi:hypothetical protein